MTEAMRRNVLRLEHTEFESGIPAGDSEYALPFGQGEHARPMRYIEGFDGKLPRFDQGCLCEAAAIRLGSHLCLTSRGTWQGLLILIRSKHLDFPFDPIGLIDDLWAGCEMPLPILWNGVAGSEKEQLVLLTPGEFGFVTDQKGAVAKFAYQDAELPTLTQADPEEFGRALIVRARVFNQSKVLLWTCRAVHGLGMRLPPDLETWWNGIKSRGRENM